MDGLHEETWTAKANLSRLNETLFLSICNHAISNPTSKDKGIGCDCNSSEQNHIPEEIVFIHAIIYRPGMAIEFMLLSTSANPLASRGICNLIGDEQYSIQIPITNLSLTLEQGSIISSFAAIRATQPSTTWLRYTRGVLPIICRRNSTRSGYSTSSYLHEWC